MGVVMPMETAKMSARGQIIIPKGIREEINADVDTLFVVSAISNDSLVMKKLDTENLLKEFRALRKKAGKLSRTQIEEEIHATRGA